MADLNVDTIASSGGGLETLTNEVVKRSGPVIAQGVATFTNANNNINLAGLGIHPEVGDVLLISGSVNNDGAFTAEFITDNDNVIVNAAHAGKSRTVSPIGTKALIDETTTVTVTLLCKWFHAPLGLGQGEVDVTSERLNNVTYTTPQNRHIEIGASSLGIGTTSCSIGIVSNGVQRAYNGSGTVTGSQNRPSASAVVKGDYIISYTSSTIVHITELR